MKKFLTALLCFFLLAGCASSPSKPTEVTSSDDNTQALATPEPNVSITLSRQFLDNFDMNSEDYVNGITEEQHENFIDVIANEDGSVTFIMSAEKNRELMKSYKEQISTKFQDMIDNDEQFSNVSNIQYNDDLSVFNITLKTDELSFVDGFSALLYAMTGGIYQIFCGIPDEQINVIVNFLNTEGNIIESTSLADIAKAGK